MIFYMKNESAWNINLIPSKINIFQTAECVIAKAVLIASKFKKKERKKEQNESQFCFLRVSLDVFCGSRGG